MIDMMFEIALHTTFKPTINILTVLPHLDTNYFWQLKGKKFNKPEINFWTPKENYLVQSKGYFCLNLCLQFEYRGQRSHIDPYLFEYFKMFNKISRPIYDHGNTYSPIGMITIPIVNQFVLIIDEYPYHIDSFNTKEDSIAYIKTRQKLLVDVDNFNGAIVDLKLISPYFRIIKY